jgi:hypothetical protein
LYTDWSWRSFDGTRSLWTGAHSLLGADRRGADANKDHFFPEEDLPVALKRANRLLSKKLNKGYLFAEETL